MLRNVGSNWVLIGVTVVTSYVTTPGLVGRVHVLRHSRVVSRRCYVGLAVMVVFVSLSFIGFLPEGIMFAHHDFVPRNLVLIAGVLLRFGMTIFLLQLHPSLSFLAAIQLPPIGRLLGWSRA